MALQSEWLSRGPPDGAWPEVNDHTDCQQLGWWFPSVIFSSVSIFLFCGYTEIFLTFYVPVVLSSCERSKVNMLPSASLSASLWLICIFYKRQLTNINQCQLVYTGICLNFLLDFSFGVLKNMFFLHVNNTFKAKTTNKADVSNVGRFYK